MTDNELIALIKQGNEGAEDEIFKIYRDLVNKISRSYFLLGGDIEDTSQEGMIGLYKAIKTFNPEMGASFKTFAGMCINHQIQTAVKKAGALKNKTLSDALPLISTREDEDDFDFSMPETMPSPEGQLISKENLKEIKDSIYKNLSPHEKRVLSCYLKGFSYNEIANLLNCSIKSIDNALFRIKTKLAFLKNLD